MVKRAIASGNQALNGNLAAFDPAKYENGFYQVRLKATDISGRTSTKESMIEVSGTTSKSAYIRKETDLTTTIGGVTLNLVRSYNSLNAGEVDTFGNGWSLANIDANIQTNVAKDSSGAIAWEAIRRFLEPSPVSGGTIIEPSIIKIKNHQQVR